MNYKHYYVKYKYLGKPHPKYNLTVSVPEGLFPTEIIEEVKNSILLYHKDAIYSLVKKEEFEIITINKL